MGEIITIIATLIILLSAILFVSYKVLQVLHGDIFEVKSILYDNYVRFDPKVDDLIALANDFWRLNNQITKISEQLSENDKKRLANSMRRLDAYLHSNDVEIDDLTGRIYTEGMTLDILNAEFDPSLPKPIIKETVRPTITFKGIIRQKPQVIVLLNEASNDAAQDTATKPDQAGDNPAEQPTTNKTAGENNHDQQ